MLVLVFVVAQVVLGVAVDVVVKPNGHTCLCQFYEKTRVVTIYLETKNLIKFSNSVTRKIFQNQAMRGLILQKYNFVNFIGSIIS